MWVIKSRIVRWVGHAVRVGKKRNAYGGFLEETERKEITWKK
jgi:hypothetical protein